MDLGAPITDLALLAQLAHLDQAASSRSDSPIQSEFAFVAFVLVSGAAFLWLAWWILLCREPEVVVRDPWSSALTQPAAAIDPKAREKEQTYERIDGTFGSWVGRGMAVCIGIGIAWFLLLFTAPCGWFLIPLVLAWVWPRKRSAAR